MSREAELLAVRNLTVSYTVGGGALAHRRTFDAVTDVSFAIGAGETVALVGESGCGKSTVARAIVGLVQPSGGTIEYQGRDLTQLGRRERRRLGSDIQMVFQDPTSSLHPRMTAEEAIVEGWRVHPERRPADREQAVRTLFEQVGLTISDRAKYPHEFSGGQRQRISIARALALAPKLLVLDEPVSALDVSIQAQVLLLLEELQRERSLAYLFISHDLDVVGQISRRALAMYLGTIVEIGPTAELLSAPGHPYTEALLAAAPSFEDEAPAASEARLSSEMPSPVDPPSGCRLRTRCWLAEKVCEEVTPPLERWTPARAVACHVRSRARQPAKA